MNLRLALYSDQAIARNAGMNKRLLRLIGSQHPRVGYVSAGPDPQRLYFNQKRKHYAQTGFDLAVYLDEMTVDFERTVAALGSCDAIHLSGGNTFSFLHWLKARGVFAELHRYAMAGQVLIGESAGSVLMTPAILTAAFCGDVRVPGSTDDSGLGLVDFYFWPHYRAGLEAIPNIAACLQQLPKVLGCPDGAGVIIDGDATEYFGEIQGFSDGIMQRRL